MCAREGLVLRFSTKRFGTIDITEDQIITFSGGLIGFPLYRRFFVLDLDTSGVFKWLQSLDDHALGFVILDPKMLFADYEPLFVEKDLVSLGAPCPDELIILSVVTVTKDAREMTVNLQAPLVINPSKRLAKQVITTVQEYTTKHEVFSHLYNLMKRTG